MQIRSFFSGLSFSRFCFLVFLSCLSFCLCHFTPIFLLLLLRGPLLFPGQSFSRLSFCLCHFMPIFLLLLLRGPLLFPGQSFSRVSFCLSFYADLSSPASSWTAFVSGPVFLSCVFLPVSFYADLSSPASSWTAFVSGPVFLSSVFLPVILCQSFFYFFVAAFLSQSFCRSACVILCRSDLSFPAFRFFRFSFCLSLVSVFLPVSFYADLSSTSLSAFLSRSFSRVCLSAFVTYTPIFLLLPLRGPLFFLSLSLASVSLPVSFYADLSSTSLSAFLSRSFSRVCLSAFVTYTPIFLLLPLRGPLFFLSLSLVSVSLPVSFYADLSSPASS